MAQLLANVTEFMALHPGDVLAVGVAAGAPRARAGQKVTIAIEGAGELTHTLVAETGVKADSAPLTSRAPIERVARVAFNGAVHTVTPHHNGVQFADGRVLPEADMVWLPPFEAGTIIALGLNYADHVKELSKELTVAAQDEPLAFLKSASALLGYRVHTHRPTSVAFMHYECELAVVIGRTAQNVKRENAMQHVAGHTVANDYAIRDHLENHYRPNLLMKNRDGCTVLGPWLVPAADVPNPHNLTLRTLINGVETQHGNTADLISDIPALIASGSQPPY